MDDFYVPWDGGERYVKKLEARIAELKAENQRLQTENEILLREKVRWILGGGENEPNNSH